MRELLNGSPLTYWVEGLALADEFRLCEVVDTFVLAAKVQFGCIVDVTQPTFYKDQSHMNASFHLEEAVRFATNASRAITLRTSIHEPGLEELSDVACNAFECALRVFWELDDQRYTAVNRERTWLICTLQHAASEANKRVTGSEQPLT